MLLRRSSLIAFEIYFLCWHSFVFSVVFTISNTLPNAKAEEYYKSETMSKIFACDFEVFGKVQGVFFRKHTQKQAKSLGLNGWCMNTYGGTVKGQLEGPLLPINEMKHWLETKGSPSSRIEKAVFSETKEISKYTFTSFNIKR